MDINGTTVRFPRATMPPVLVGGNSTAAMDRAIRFGADWCPSMLPDLAAGITELRRRAAAADKPAPEVTAGGHLFVSQSPDEFVRGLVEVHGLPEDEARRAPITLDRVAAFAEAGARRVVVSVDTPDEQAWRADVTALARAYVRQPLPSTPLPG